MPSSVPSTGHSQSEYSAFSAARLGPGSLQVLGRGNGRREEERKGSRERERERKGRGREGGRKGERKQATQEKSEAATQCNLEGTGTMSRRALQRDLQHFTNAQSHRHLTNKLPAL